MKRKTSFIAAVWWVTLCLVAGVFLMAFSDKHSRESDAENRMLQGFPEFSMQRVLSGEFMTDFETFLTDGFIGRDSAISFTNGLLDVFSVMSTDDRIAAATADMERELETGALQVENPGDEAALTVLADVPGVVEVELPSNEEDEPEEEASLVVEEGQIPITDTHSFLWFEMADGSLKRNYTYNKSDIDTYAETLKIMQTYLPDDGQILFTQVPLAQIANRWVLQQDEYVGWGSSVEQMLEDSLAGTERIHVFSTYDILEPYVTGDPPMYYRTDHHWTAEGAYKVCAEMLRTLGLPVIPYEEYDYKSITSSDEVDGWHDTFNVLYPLLPAHSYVVTNRDSMKELSLMNYDSTTYRAYMNNTRLPWRRIITGANTGRNALVLCDSFGNAFTPYLLPYYDEVHMADFRKGSYSKSQAGGSIGELIGYYGIDDVYIVTSTANGLRKNNSIVYLRKYLVE